MTAGPDNPHLHVVKGTCGAATTAGPYDVIRGDLEQMAVAGGSVDLGPVECVAGGLTWDRATDLSPDPNPQCNPSVVFFLARHTGASDFGTATGGEPRDTMDPSPPCP
jgi:hypothetical protein